MHCCHSLRPASTKQGFLSSRTKEKKKAQPPLRGKLKPDRHLQRKSRGWRRDVECATFRAVQPLGSPISPIATKSGFTALLNSLVRGAADLLHCKLN